MKERLSQCLEGSRILVADDDVFRGGYIAHGLVARGAEVVGPFYRSLALQNHLAEAADQTNLAYLGCGDGLDEGYGTISKMSERGYTGLVICSPSIAEGTLPSGSVVLRPTIAAFQVVEAFVHLTVGLHATRVF